MTRKKANFMRSALSRRQFLQRGGTAGLVAGAVSLPAVLDGPASAQEGATTFDGDGYVFDHGGQVFHAKAFGVTGDTRWSLTGGSITAGSAEFTQSATASGATQSAADSDFTEADENKVITVQGAGPDGTVLSSRIQAVTSGKTATLAHEASTTVASAEFTYGTDDTVAIVAAFDAAGATGLVFFPPGRYSILGSSNGTKKIVHSGNGGILGRGGMDPPSPTLNAPTIFVCCDADAGLALNGSGRYQGFECHGNQIATNPLQSGVVDGSTVVEAPSHAVYREVFAHGGTGTGWKIYGAKHSSYYACGVSLNVEDGLYIDGGCEDLTFYNFTERSNNRYGMRSAQEVTAATGELEKNRHIRFYSGLGDGGSERPGQVAKVFLEHAVGWRFEQMVWTSTNTDGGTIQIDQSTCLGIDLSDCEIIGNNKAKKGVDGGNSCVVITGAAPEGRTGTLLRVDRTHFRNTDNSVHVAGDPKGYRYTAVGGWWDATGFGPYAAPGLPAADTLFVGRSGPWHATATTSPWSGDISYRFMGEGWVELRGTVRYSPSGSGPMTALPKGYWPEVNRSIPVRTSVGAGVLTIAPSGELSARSLGGSVFVGTTDVHLDGIQFPVGGAVAPPSSASIRRVGTGNVNSNRQRRGADT